MLTQDLIYLVLLLLLLVSSAIQVYLLGRIFDLAHRLEASGKHEILCPIIHKANKSEEQMVDLHLGGDY